MQQMRLNQTKASNEVQDDDYEQMENPEGDSLNLESDTMDKTHERMNEQNASLKDDMKNMDSENMDSENKDSKNMDSLSGNSERESTPEEEVQNLSFQMESLKKHSVMHAQKMLEIGKQIQTNVSENYDERVQEIVQKNYIHFRDELQIKNGAVFLYLDKQIQLLEGYKGNATENIQSIQGVVERCNQVLQRLISSE